MTGIVVDVRGEKAAEGFYTALVADDPGELYDRAPCGYLSTLPDGTITKVNQTFLTWTGYERRDLVGRRTFADLLTGGGKIYHETHYAPLLRMQGTVREIALEIVGADGRRLPALVNAVLDVDAAGEPAAIRTAVFDATERRRYEQELLRAKQRAEESEAHARLLSRTLQQSLMPPAPPGIPGLELSAAYRPAGDGHEIGGDFYDVLQVGEDDWIVVVGDVRGKGVGAAVVTGLVRHTIRATAVTRPRPSALLATLNEVLLRYGTDRFCTVAIVLLQRRERWTATTSCGGHPLPLLRRERTPPVEVGVPGTLLGVFPGAAFEERTADLRPGDALVLYTDGVTEARRAGAWYGEDGLSSALSAQAGGADLADRIVADVVAFQSDLPRDDIVVVAVSVPAAA